MTVAGERVGAAAATALVAALDPDERRLLDDAAVLHDTNRAELEALGHVVSDTADRRPRRRPPARPTRRSGRQRARLTRHRRHAHGERRAVGSRQRVRRTFRVGARRSDPQPADRDPSRHRRARRGGPRRHRTSGDRRRCAQPRPRRHPPAPRPRGDAPRQPRRPRRPGARRVGRRHRALPRTRPPTAPAAPATRGVTV